MNRILVAGIGNIFLGDDGFGVEVVRTLAQRPQQAGVRVVDFGIRGMDLVYALLDEYEAVIFVDTVARGESPGTLYLIEPWIEEGPAALEPRTGVTLDTHGMDPVKVLALARELGAPPTRIYIVGCEPAFLVDGQNDPDVVVELTAPVQGAIERAVEMVEKLIAEIGAQSDMAVGIDR